MKIAKVTQKEFDESFIAKGICRRLQDNRTVDVEMLIGKSSRSYGLAT